MASVYLNSIFNGLRPLPMLTVSQWADTERILSRVSSSEAGQWRTSRTPFLEKIMDSLSVKSTYQTVVFKKASQIGATELGINWIGYTIDHDPSPMMVILPTDSLIDRFVKQRITPLIETTPAVKSKFSTLKKDESNTKTYKAFPGGALVFSGANSPSSLRSMPAEKIFADEIDAYPKDTGGEGSPLSLATARQRTFSRKKTFLCSTPVEEGNSLISDSFESTDQNFYHVPCPKCGHVQRLIFKLLKWDEVTKEVWYECEENQCKIFNWQKTEMLEAGGWVSHMPENADVKRIGFHLSSLYSPVGWLSWEQIIFDKDEGYLAALNSGSDVKMKVFTNTILGETFSIKSEVPDHNRLWERSRACDYKFNQPPNDALFLTCGVDVQKDRLEALVVGWGRNKVSWTIDYRVFYGDTSQAAVYKDLENMLNETFIHMDGKRESKIAVMAVDTGFNTQAVYNWCRKQRGSRVLAIKGFAKQKNIIGSPSPVDIKMRGTTIKKGLKLWPLGVNIIKEEIYSWLKLDQPKDGEATPTGFCHFLPFGEDFFLMLTAEKMVYLKDKKGFEVVQWEKIRDRNETLDCLAYARAAAAYFGIDKYTEAHWTKLEYQVGWQKEKQSVKYEQVQKITAKSEKPVIVENNKSIQKKKFKIKRSSFIHG